MMAQNDRTPQQTHQWSRRRLLQSATALGLSFSLPAMSPVQAGRRRTERLPSLVTLWMQGGMSQLESWDPHPGSPTGGEVKDIRSTLSDVRISEFLPQMAEQMHRTTLIRSLTSLEGDHERGSYFVKTGYRLEPTLTYPSLGAIAAYNLRDEELEIPSHVSLGGNAFFPRGGYLGNEWDAFRVFDPGRSMSNLRSGVSRNRAEVRREGLGRLTRSFSAQRPGMEERTLHGSTMERAFRMMSSEQLRAFELEEESDTVRAAYGDSSFGRGCLVARRLVETGVRSVEVCLNGFDTHVNNHEGQKTQCEMLDPAFATLLQELADRDLLESTIVLCISEFGRTPVINPAGGRDHWPNWFSCVIAGGGFRSGQVIGATPAEFADSGRPLPSQPVTIPQLYATIMMSMGIDFREEIITPIGRPIRYADAEPLPDLLDSAAIRT